ncbi:MAG: hypothetical protein M3Y50_08960, partial [Acidobacteriota bacterium]|nr:hypothetical protein [Acidobacteriota bacterium]
MSREEELATAKKKQMLCGDALLQDVGRGGTGRRRWRGSVANVEGGLASLNQRAKAVSLREMPTSQHRDMGH